MLNIYCQNFLLLLSGDGNCLLHAVSLAMWSITDDQTVLRRLVYYALVQAKESFFSRWRKRQERVDLEEGGMTHSKTVKTPRQLIEHVFECDLIFF